jgi:ferritin-like protein
MSLQYIQELQMKVDQNQAQRFLKVILADAFNSVHNMGMQALMIEGYNKEDIARQLESMKAEEMANARLLISRILELGGNPDIRPITWDNIAMCDYQPIHQTDQKDIIEDVYDTKMCRTQSLVKALQFLEGRDQTSYDLVNKILEAEYKDIETLRKLRESLLTNQEKEAANDGEIAG